MSESVSGNTGVPGGILKEEKTPSNAVNSTTKGATFLMLSAIVSKLFTFSLNQMLVRFITPSLFGVSAYLEFVYLMLLFFSREAVRLSVQRTVPKDHHHQTIQSIVNFGHVALVLGVVLSGGLFAWQSNSAPFKEASAMTEYFIYVVFLYWLAAILELVVEPIYDINQYTLNFARRSKFEGLAIFSRCVVTVGIILAIPSNTDSALSNGYVLLGFGLGQLAYSLVLFLCYGRSFACSELNVSYFPKPYNGTNYFDQEVVGFWKIAFVQMIFKQFLTEGDKFIMNSFFGVAERGVYTVISNYGSIIVRMLFQPIEESIRLSFTRALTEYKQVKAEDYLKSAVQTIKLVLMLYCCLSILIALSGYVNSSYLLKIVLGGKSSHWLGTGLFEIMPIYILYIPFLAFNGVLEAFVTAAASNKQTTRYSLFMTAVSVLVLFLSYVFIERLGLGLVGLVYSNIINMTLRIVYCGFFITHFFNQEGVNNKLHKALKFALSIVRTGAIGFYIHYKFLGFTQSSSLKEVVQSALVCGACALFMLIQQRRELPIGAAMARLRG